MNRIYYAIFGIFVALPNYVLSQAVTCEGNRLETEFVANGIYPGTATYRINLIRSDGGKEEVWFGSHKVMGMALCGGGVVTVFSENGGGKSYFSPDCRNIAGGGNTTSTTGSIPPKGVAQCGTGVVVAYDGAAYYSPDCQNLAGGGDTAKVYEGSHTNENLLASPNGVGVLAKWKSPRGSSRTYYSPDCMNLGGGGKTGIVADIASRKDDGPEYIHPLDRPCGTIGAMCWDHESKE